MGRDSWDDFKVCDDCGSFYLNFCVHCQKAGMEERVLELMDRYGMNEAELIELLSKHVKGGSFPALSKAINMRDMMPAERIEAKVDEGNEIRAAKERLGNLLSRLTSRRRAE